MNIKKYVSIICAISLVTLSAGCGKTETVIEYPTAVSDSGSNEKTETDIKDNESAEQEETNNTITDTLRTNGTFYYNPTILNPMYKDHLSEDLQKEAIMIMESVYNHDLTIDFSALKPEESSVKLAMGLAQLSSPFCESITLEEDVNGIYSIIYPYEENVMREKIAFYEKEVSDMINERIRPSATDAERAKIVYEWLVEEFEFDYDSVDSAMGSIETVPGYEGIDDMTFMEVKHGSVFNFDYTYALIMFQLGIDCNIMGSMGSYEAQGYEYLDELFQTNKTYFYDYFRVGDKWYYCDLFFEKMAFDDAKENYPNAECEFKYFGMSDETRNKSWKVQYKSVAINLVPAKSPAMPTCSEDLEI